MRFNFLRFYTPMPIASFRACASHFRAPSLHRSSSPGLAAFPARPVPITPEHVSSAALDHRQRWRGPVAGHQVERQTERLSPSAAPSSLGSVSARSMEMAAVIAAASPTAPPVGPSSSSTASWAISKRRSISASCASVLPGRHRTRTVFVGHRLGALLVLGPVLGHLRAARKIFGERRPLRQVPPPVDHPPPVCRARRERAVDDRHPDQGRSSGCQSPWRRLGGLSSQRLGNVPRDEQGPSGRLRGQRAARDRGDTASRRNIAPSNRRRPERSRDHHTARSAMVCEIGEQVLARA